MLADGWVKGNQVAIALQEDDLPIIEAIKAEWGTDNKIITSQKKPFKNKKADKTYCSKSQKRIMVNSPIMVNDLARWGIVERKSLITFLPILDKYMSHFFRGMIDGDGSIYKHSNKRLVCVRFLGSHYLIAQICLYLHLILGLGYRQPAPKENISYVNYCIKDDVQKLLNFAYKDKHKSLYLERKFLNAKDYLC